MADLRITDLLPRHAPAPADELAEFFDANELRNFLGRWTAGGGHTTVPFPEQVPKDFVPGSGSKAPRALARRVPAVERPQSAHSVPWQRYEGGVRRMSGATTKRLAGVFTKAERESSKPLQKTGDLNEIYKLEPAATKRLEGVLRQFSTALGGTYHDLNKDSIAHENAHVARTPHLTHVIMGPTKKMEEAAKKVATKYGGDASHLSDVSRATIAVPHVDDLAHAVETVRRELPAGWSIHAPENRYVKPQGKGDKINTGPKGGYRDISVLLRDPQGFVHELQINTTHMVIAKNGKGHALYEESRVLERASEQRKLTREEENRLARIERQSRRLYETANTRSTRRGSTGPIRRVR